jgi:rare lipoprotein A
MFSTLIASALALASWYGPGYHGRPTASGEPFNQNAMTAASPYLPFGTRLKVCLNGCVVVRINDRGPFTGGRQLDLSKAAADAIGLTSQGVARVSITRLN